MNTSLTIWALLRMLFSQFAYNEVSFMLVRLLQSFSTIELDTTSQPPDTRPPESWKNVGGRQAIERIFPKSHLSIYSHVSFKCLDRTVE